MNWSHDVVVIGAGQSGLSISHELSRAGREHVVLDRGSVAQTWRTRWDSFSLVLPNWTIRLAGGRYDGNDPKGFMLRDEFVEFLSAYARSFQAPIQEGIDVRSLRPVDGGFALKTSAGEITAREVVVATGGMSKAYTPAALAQLPGATPVIPSADYRNPEALPPGGVLIVGSGQTGCQLADELRVTGRQVYLACGKSGWAPRRVGDRDLIEWVVQTPLFTQTVADLPSPLARLAGNPQATGRNGGYDLHYRTLQAGGVVLTGHVLGVEDGSVHFADDLADSVAFGDARYNDLRGFVAKVAAAEGENAPVLPDPPPFNASAPASVRLTEVGSVIVASGYRPDYASWIKLPRAFDDMGFPVQVDGSSTVQPGLHFMGGQFQRNRSSASLYGVGEDAEALAAKMTAPPGASVA